MPMALIAFDTDHIKSYVFQTDKLKEIRGASSLLDGLNREAMQSIAGEKEIQAIPIYCNGGSGLFVVDEAQAERFGHKVQRAFHDRTRGGATVTFVVQPLPDKFSLETNEQARMKLDLYDELELLRYRLREAKGRSADSMALLSHPFMQQCASCGRDYASKPKDDQNNPGTDAYYCQSCAQKQDEDVDIKTHIDDSVKVINRLGEDGKILEQDLWQRILYYLNKAGYVIDKKNPPVRPEDFDAFRDLGGSKSYFGLIYADGNNMGRAVEKQTTLGEQRKFANDIDTAIHQAMSIAIAQHLPLPTVDQNKVPVFPFDILLLGGDDIVMLTDATKALQVSLTIAQEFRRIMKEKSTEDEYSLSIGVVLAPIRYPFGLLQDMVESTLKYAKTASAKARVAAKKNKQDGIDDTRINFMVVTGGALNEFKSVYNSVYRETDKNDHGREFYATLRPYSPDDLSTLLKLIQKGRQLNLGRSKLHQVREAILQKNATTAVSDGLAVLRNWRERQRSFVVNQLYMFGNAHRSLLFEEPDARNPLAKFPRVVFPWFLDGKSQEGRDIYRTSLLDFIELYDFVASEGDTDHDGSSSN